MEVLTTKGSQDRLTPYGPSINTSIPKVGQPNTEASWRDATGSTQQHHQESMLAENVNFYEDPRSDYQSIRNAKYKQIR